MRVRGRIRCSVFTVLSLGLAVSAVHAQTRSSGKGDAVREGSTFRTSSRSNVAVAPAVSTDLTDYAPGETAWISGSGFDANETVTLQVAHMDGTPPGGEGHNPWYVTTDESGSFSSSWFVNPDDSGGSEFLLTADCVHGLHAETTFTDIVGGNGVVTNVTADDGGCVAVSSNTQVTTWDVQPGKTYTVTIEGVNDAANGGTDATMLFFLQNSTTGNLCLTGQKVSTGVYTMHITIPVYACETSPINYGSCDNNAKRAKGNAADANPLTTVNGVHLRANTNCTSSGALSCSTIEACCEGTVCNDKTISNCLNPTLPPVGIPMGPGVRCADSPCDRRCEVDCPANIQVDCNGSTDPADTGFATCSDGCTASYTDSAVGGACPQESTITRTWTCDDGNGHTATCDQIITVVDTTPPVVTCPGNCEIECGTATCDAPLCDDPSCQCGDPPSCTDDCGDCTITSTCEFFPGGCDVGGVAGVTPPPKLGTVVKTYAGTDGSAAIAAGGCPNVATCTQTIQIVDTTPPVFTVCPTNITVQNDAGQCCAAVGYQVAGEDTCDDTVSINCSTPSGTCFPVGTTSVGCRAEDACGNADDTCGFTVTVNTSICGRKTYDAGADGGSAGDAGIAGWKVVLTGPNGTTTKYTGADGRYCFNGLAAGSYTVTEVAPNASWTATSGTSCSFPDLTCPGSCAFNNLCIGAGGGLTLGYWSNKNGENTMKDGGTLAPELAMLSGLNLKNATGADFNPATYTSFRDWLLKATAENMAYMLSAQLSAMALNVEAGKVGAGSLLYSPGCGNTGIGNNYISVSNLLTAANAALGADGYTPSGDPNRATQECLKNALDRGNNNLNFVQAGACPFATPY